MASSPVHVCPTKGRAGRVTTDKVVPDLILCVAESEAGFYREAHGELEIVEHPDDVVGLAPKRQWIAGHFGDVFMVDDDLNRVVDLTIEPGKSPPLVPRDRVGQHIGRLHRMAEEMGVYLYSFSSNCDARFCRAQKPFSIQGYCPGHAFGIRSGHGLWWHAGMRTMEDWWISALNAHYHRMMLRDNRFGFGQVDTFKNPGGQANFRSSTREEQSFDLLREHFGQAIRLRGEKTMHSNGKETVLRPAHAFQPAVGWKI